MITRIFLTLAFSTLTYTTVFSQSPTELLNSLPPTSEVPAPEFNVENKYIFRIDSINHQLIIVSQPRHPVTKQPHFDQQLFEIPLSQLNAQSLKIQKDEFKDEALSLSITLTEGQNDVIVYWVRDDNIVSIQSQKNVILRPWPNDEQTHSRLLEATDSFTSQLTSNTESPEMAAIAAPTFKYGTSQVTMIGTKDLDGKLNDGYYLAHALEQPPVYQNSKDLASSIRNLKKIIANQLRKADRTIVPKTPVFIYVDESGAITSTYAVYEDTEEIRDMPTIVIANFKPGLLHESPVKCKIVFIM